MPKNNKYLTKRQVVREQARRKRKVKRVIPLVVLGVGLIFLAASIYWVSSNRPAQAARDYTPEDVVYDMPLFAVHEMEPFNPAAIPFLPEGDPQPVIALSETFHNFGVIGLKDVVTRDYVIANHGDAPLTISRAYTTCGCTTAEITASVIPPGKVALVNLVFDAGFHDTGGQTVQRGLIIESNDPQNPRTEIWVQASVRNTP
ncbi:MAG: DUF1573 domain-containing protein [Anaerolineales bacterium]|nr:DUF1573 domain-containing protein [Anaerolineales bacterium]